MHRRIHVFDPPERFIAGTVGQPGERSFFLQARGDSGVVTVAVEKEQVTALASRLDDLLSELDRHGVAVPGPVGEVETDNAPLDLPLEEDFRVAAIVLGWDPANGQIIVEAQAPYPPSGTAPVLSDDPEGPDVLRVRMSPTRTRSFIDRANRVIAAGRKPCPLCGLPLDPSGHVCPRQNGHRQRDA